MDSDIFGDYDQAFIIYATHWAAEELAKCETEDDFTAFPHVITTRLKKHMLDLDEFFYLSHCEDSATEEEKFAAAKRYEEHVNYACSLTWALFMHEVEHGEMEKDSPPVCEDNE